MKLHDLQPAAGAHRKRKRVGRGIAAGGGKTAGRGTKGQKARAGASIPAWFEGGQTPLQMRIPKLHGFKNRFRVEYEVVNLGRINALVEAGVFEPGDLPVKGKGKAAGSSRSGSSAPITINQEILRVAGLVSTLKKPLKILGQGDLSAPLFVVADSFSRSATRKIEAAGGSVQVLEVPREPLAALGLDAPEVPSADEPAGLAAVAAQAVTAEPEPSQAGSRLPRSKPARRPSPATNPPRMARLQAQRPRPRPPRPGPPRPGPARRPQPARRARTGRRASPRARPSRPSLRPSPKGRPSPRGRPSRPPVPPGLRRRPPPPTPKTPDRCSNPCSTRSARPTSGAGSCSSPGF